MANIFWAFGGVLVVSLISLIGIFAFSLREDILKKYTFIFMSLAVGALLGDAFIHLIPESFESFSNPLIPSLLIIVGLFCFFILEKFLHWHHHGEDKNDTHIHPAGKLVLISDGVHNFIDGIIIGISFLVSIPFGIAATLAIILHEIPQEIGDFAVLLHSGYTKMRALWLNFMSALLSVAGVIVALLLGSKGESLTFWLLPIAAGGFIYIAVADLIPELHKAKNNNAFIMQFVAVLVGILLMILLAFLE